jgi:flagellar basal-body rod protein FlgB
VDLTTTLLGHALEAAGLNEQVIAANLANLDTPGYRARQVSFASLLAEATSAAGARAVRPTVTVSDIVYSPNGNGVDVDQEMVALAHAALRYTFIADELRSRYQDLKLASAGVP